jgi:membrane protein YqaA with SNARE-associated domain
VRGGGGRVDFTGDKMYLLIVVYLIGMLGIQKAIPVGIVLNIPPQSICLMTILGASTVVILIYVLGSKVRMLVVRRMEGKRLNTKKKKIDKLMLKFGVIGLGLLGTLIMGSHLTTLIGLIVVHEKTKLLLWIIIGILFWTSLLTAVAELSSDLFKRVLFLHDFLSVSKKW